MQVSLLPVRLWEAGKSSPKIGLVHVLHEAKKKNAWGQDSSIFLFFYWLGRC